MTKKLISVAAAAAICSTAALASQVLVVPAYFAGNGWSTDLEVYNTSKEAIVAKVVLYKATDSAEVRDFNIYLSGKDAWSATIKESTAGSYVITSTDSSSPVEGKTTMASATDPMTASVSVSNGYALIMTMGYIDIDSTTANSGTAAGFINDASGTNLYHQKHAEMQADYAKFALKERGNMTANQYTFTSGLIDGVKYWDFNRSISTDDMSKAPMQDVVTTSSTTKAYTYNTTATTGFVVMKNITTEPLFGLVKMTNTTNGTNMVADMRSFNFNGDTTANESMPLWLEGEAASLRDINGSALVLAKAISNTNNKANGYTITDVNATGTVYVPYTAGLESQVLFLDPTKRDVLNAYAKHIASTATANTTATKMASYSGSDTAALIPHYYSDATYTNTTTANSGKISSYGCFKAQLSVRDMNENLASASKFSPATTPVVKLCNELSVSEGNSDSANNFSTYITQAGYSKGFVEVALRESGNSSAEYPFIVTQMLATKSGSQTVINWFNPSVEE